MGFSKELFLQHVQGGPSGWTLHFVDIKLRE